MLVSEIRELVWYFDNKVRSQLCAQCPTAATSYDISRRDTLTLRFFYANAGSPNGLNGS